MTKPSARTRPERCSLLLTIADTLHSEGFPDREARSLAAKLTASLRRKHRGEMIYVANADEADRDARDAAICRDYDGTRASRERLQLRYDISRAQFYRIINEKKKAENA